MKKIYLGALVNVLFTGLSAQTFDWAKKGGLWAYDYGYAITTDHSGNVYVTGKYEMNANFSGHILPNQGNHDIFLAQYNSSGDLNWITTAGGELGDYGECIAVNNNNVYIGGEIEGVNKTIVFENSSVTLTTSCFNDIFFAKYDLNGNLVWAKKEGWWHNEKALGMTTDNAGNLYICGFFVDTTFIGGNMVVGYGENDIFVAKYDANGNFKWVRKAGGPGRDEAKSVVCDAAGNVYVCGMFKQNCSFGSQTVTSNQYFDLFLAKYDTNGNLVWVKKAGDTYDDVAWGVTIDNTGKIYITGEIIGYVMFGSTALATSGMSDVFVACYDQNGNVQWAKRAGGALIDRARGIGTDGNTIYITGQFGATAGFGNTTLASADSSDIFIAAISNSGNWLWAKSVGGTPDSLETLGYESGIAVCGTPNGSVYATGSFLNNAIFGSTTLTTFDRTDMFITKITQVGVGLPEEPVTGKPFIFPNPSNGNLIFSGFRFPAEVFVYNSMGEIILRKKLDSGNLETDLAAGVYLVELRSGDDLYRGKFMIR